MTETISVTGTGTATRPPDIATLSLGVEVTAASVAVARATAANGAAAVIGSLRSNGIEGRDLTTSAYTISPEYDHREGRRLRGYRVSNTLEAVVRDLSSIGSVVDAAAEAGSDSTVVHGNLEGSIAWRILRILTSGASSEA
jgi:uncharacterized protein YggE